MRRRDHVSGRAFRTCVGRPPGETRIGDVVRQEMQAFRLELEEMLDRRAKIFEQEVEERLEELEL